MPQVRDPKTGRYTSGGSSSVGGAAGINPRVQRAKAVGGGATAGGGQSYKAMREQEAIEMMSPRASRAIKTALSDGTSREVLSKYNRDISNTEKRLKAEKNKFRQTVLAQELVTLRAEKKAIDAYAENYNLL